jgi:hypothetical protein
MGKNFAWLVLALLVCSLFACTNKNDNTPQKSILGKWNLQHEHLVQYVNGQKQVDTIFTTTTNFYNYVQFNKDGTYMSNSVIRGTSYLQPIILTDTVRGSYSISANTFNLSYVAIAFFAQQPIPLTMVPIISQVSTQSQLNQLSSSALVFHAEIINTYTYPNTGSSQNNRWEMDYTYSK